jgi:hypothetical protein
MTPDRYKTLLSYLPGMATVVNAFSSPEVQRVVFDELLQSLNVRMEHEGVKPLPLAKVQALKHAVAQLATADDELEQELAEGGSIHAFDHRN